jgi:hypothetical protein
MDCRSSPLDDEYHLVDLSRRCSKACSGARSPARPSSTARSAQALQFCLFIRRNRYGSVSRLIPFGYRHMMLPVASSGAEYRSTREASKTRLSCRQRCAAHSKARTLRLDQGLRSGLCRLQRRGAGDEDISRSVGFFTISFCGQVAYEQVLWSNSIVRFKVTTDAGNIIAQYVGFFSIRFSGW